MSKPWLKLWTETLHDRKLRRAKPAWRWCWCGLLMIAAESERDGALLWPDGATMNDDDLAAELGVTAQEWTGARDYFSQLGMLQRSDTGSLTVTNFAKRQAPQDPFGAKRQAEYRERHALRDALRNGSDAPVNESGISENQQNLDNRGQSTEDRGNASHNALRNGTQPPPRLPTKSVANAFMNARGGAVNPMDLEQIADLAQLYGDDTTVRAITYCSEHRKQPFLAIGYIAKTLAGWQEHGNGRGKSRALDAFDVPDGYEGVIKS